MLLKDGQIYYHAIDYEIIHNLTIHFSLIWGFNLNKVSPLFNVQWH